MKLENYGVQELSLEESMKIIGGSALGAAAMGLAALYLYSQTMHLRRYGYYGF